MERMLLDHVFGGVATVLPATLHVALSTAIFNAVTPGLEVTGGSYTRAAIARNQTNFPLATSGNPSSMTLAVALGFPTATASWGTIASIYVYNATTAGDWLYGGDLTVNKAVASGDSPIFNPGSLIFRET